MRIFTVLFAIVLMAATSTLAKPVVLHRGNIVEPGTLDMHKHSLDYETEILRDLFMGLLTINTSAQPIPGLAQSWTVSPDGKVYTFKLRPNLRWSDGIPLTADDAVYGIRRGMDPKTLANYANQLYAIKNARAVNAGKLGLDQLGVRSIDPQTVEITLERPAPSMLLILSNTPMFYPAPKHLIEKVGNGWTKPGVMVSSGAYKLAAWRAGDHVRVVKNPYFFDAANVRIDEVRYYPTVDDSAALNRFRAGELDLNTRFPPNQIAWLMKNLPGQAFVTPALWVTYLVPNFRKKPFDDARVRRALSLAIDRSTLTEKILRNGEKPFAGMVPDTIPGYRSLINLDPRPLAERQIEARALLATAGFGPKNPLKFTFSQRSGLNNRLAAVAVTDMWKQVGVTAELLQAEVAVHYEKLRVGDFQLADAGWANNADPEFFVYLALTSSTEINYGHYSNPKFDQIVETTSALANKSDRFKNFAEAEKLALDDNAIIPLFISAERILVKPYLKGLQRNPMGQYPTRFMWIEGKP